jgi:hypothetical protein
MVEVNQTELLEEESLKNVTWDHSETANCSLSSVNITPSSDVLCDSGAQRIIFNQHYLTYISNFKPIRGDTIGSGSLTVGAIRGSGTCILFGIEMPCLYAPNLTKSVVSVSALSDYNIEVTFKKGDVFMKLPGDKRKIRCIRSERQLYTMDPDVIQLRDSTEDFTMLN